ncbi:hypothetical protein GCM10020369_08780 [Cryptosporangium minutisporangium]|uniref:HTH iclR-type domain-containing protein n=1 Tax=Cryptosporangium minutisporangium TaxID=113569 RepID=A0ABP6SRA3_9ACTN
MARFNSISQERRVQIVSGVLSALLGRRSPATITDLEDTTGKNAAVLKHILGQLVERGYVTERNTPHGKGYWLTAIGKSAYDRYHAGNAQIFTGDFFQVGDNSTVVNRSSVDASFNPTAADPAAPVALVSLSFEVRNSGNLQAQDLMDRLLSELNRTPPRLHVLRSYLSALAEAHPGISPLLLSEVWRDLQRMR